MRHTQHLAQTHCLTREVLMVGHSKEDGLYKVHVAISNHSRRELQYWFIDGNTKIDVAVAVAVDSATEAFLGLGSQHVIKTVEQLEMAISSSPKNEVSDASQEKSNEESKPKRKSRQSSSEKEKVVAATTESPATEEMEVVESPFKAESKSIKAEVESPAKESAKSESKKAKITAEPYNREDKTSKASFASYVTKLHKGGKEWKERADLKEISTKLHGQPFLEKDGSIHPDFEASCKEMFELDSDAL